MDSFVAIKIWLKAFEDDRWDWHILPSDSQIPDRLLMEILGSRKPILFVEGDRHSLDFFVFSKLYPEHTVVPCGGASAVIHATRSFAALKNLHNLECRGIIDRDFRTAAEVARLKELQIFSLEVSEVENLFFCEWQPRRYTAKMRIHRARANPPVTFERSSFLNFATPVTLTRRHSSNAIARPQQTALTCSSRAPPRIPAPASSPASPDRQTSP